MNSHLQSIIEKCHENIKDIPWFEWRYATTKDWRIWSYPKKWSWWHKWKFIKQFIKPDNYKSVRLYNSDSHKRHSVHRLVAMAWLPNPENKPTVNHKDWNKQNNNLNNLEWATHSENTIHSFVTNIRKRRWYPIIQKNKEWDVIAIYESGAHAQRKTWICRRLICSCVRWRSKTCAWFKWEFYNK